MGEGDLDPVSELAMLANPFTTKEEHSKHLKEELEEFPQFSFVAILDDDVVGYTQADARDGEATLDDLAAAAQHQGKGIGSRLPETVMEALRLEGAESVLAEVHYKCSSAVPFYYGHGFRITGFERDCFGEGHDALLLALDVR